MELTSCYGLNKNWLQSLLIIQHLKNRQKKTLRSPLFSQTLNDINTYEERLLFSDILETSTISYQ